MSYGFRTNHYPQMNERYYQSKKDAAQRIYGAHPLIYSPFFKADILLGSEGFQHLSVSAEGERSREEQVRRFIVLPLGLQILTTATTLRSYRRRLMTVGAPGNGRQSKERKLVQGWGFREHFADQGITVGVVVRKVGHGRLHFWSVMLYTSWNAVAPNVFASRRDEIPSGDASRILLPRDPNPPPMRV